MTTSSPIRIAFLLFPNVTQLDFTGPVQVLSRLGNARLDLVWKTPEPVQTDAGFAILPTATLAEVDRADILCVGHSAESLQGISEVLMDYVPNGCEGNHVASSNIELVLKLIQI